MEDYKNTSNQRMTVYDAIELLKRGFNDPCSVDIRALNRAKEMAFEVLCFEVLARRAGCEWTLKPSSYRPLIKSLRKRGFIPDEIIKTKKER